MYFVFLEDRLGTYVKPGYFNILYYLPTIYGGSPYQIVLLSIDLVSKNFMKYL